jgi:hypothetical protein
LQAIVGCLNYSPCGGSNKTVSNGESDTLGAEFSDKNDVHPGFIEFSHGGEKIPSHVAEILHGAKRIHYDIEVLELLSKLS